MHRVWNVLFAACALGLACGAVSAQVSDSCPRFGWERFTNPGAQDYTIVQQHSSPLGHQILEVDFGELKGDYAKAFLFAEFRGDCLLRMVSVGSYSFTAEYHAKANPDATYRLFHADLYESETHSTLGFFEGEPNVDEIRAMAMEILSQPIIDTPAETDGAGTSGD